MNMKRIKAEAKARGSFFFTKGAMEYFDSIVYNSPTRDMGNGKVRFITSERLEDMPRKFTVREMDLTKPFAPGEDIGGFYVHSTFDEAAAHIDD